MQNIQLNSLPHIGDRFVAGLVDYILIFGLTFFYAYQFGEPNGEGGYSVSGVKALPFVGIWFFFTVGLELILGATLGNYIIGIKPIPEENIFSSTEVHKPLEKISFSQSFKRHFLDTIDMSFFGLIGIIIMKNSPNKKRIGDIWAKTVVIRKVDFKK